MIYFININLLKIKFTRIFNLWLSFTIW